MKKISIITPTYNRAHLLPNTYHSLLQQSSQDFEWIIMDDGSVDDTRRVVSGFMEEQKIPIKYARKENGGKHTALNASHPYIAGDYVLILDDDDTLTCDAVETILQTWQTYESNPGIGCLSFLRGRTEKDPLTNWVPTETIVSDHIDYRVIGFRNGDCAEIIRADLFK